MSNLVGVDKVARALNLTPRRVQQLVQDGLPREAKGQYDLGKCTLWYIRYLQSHQSEGTVESGMSAKDRLMAAKAEREELALAKERKEVISLDLYETSMASILSAIRTNLLAVSARLRPAIGDHADLVDEQIRKALRAMKDENGVS